MRLEIRWSTQSSSRWLSGTFPGSLGRSAAGSAGSGGPRWPVTSKISSTSQMSALRRRNIPAIPVCEAIASIRTAILSNVGPDVSARTKRSLRT